MKDSDALTAFNIAKRDAEILLLHFSEDYIFTYELKFRIHISWDNKNKTKSSINHIYNMV